MSDSSSNSSSPSSSPASRAVQVKLVVGSAAEAVETIRQRFGAAAKVISVKQSEAAGLRKLISKPRLEVVVEVPRSALEQKAPAAQLAAGPAKPKAERRKETNTKEKTEPDGRSEAEPPHRGKENELPSAEREAKRADRAETPAEEKGAPGEPISQRYQAKKQSAASSYFSQFGGSGEASGQGEAEEAPLGTAANPVKRGTIEHVRRAISMLESVGFDRAMIERIRYDLDFDDLGQLPAMELYGRICGWLRDRFPSCKGDKLAPRRAFIGSSGSGKTATLCKLLSADLFVNEAEPSVLKIDSDVPNASDGLEAFCEVMGSRLARDWEEVEEISEQRPLFVDLPGLNFGNPVAVENCRELLDEMGIEERILVINAAYESEMIAEALAAGERLGANRVAFTRLDETRRGGKLWKFVLNSRIKPYLFSYGPNPAGDYTLEIFSHLLEKTFPQSRLIANYRKAAGRDRARRSEEVAAR